MDDKKYNHIVFTEPPEYHDYKSVSGGGGKPDFPGRDRKEHSDLLKTRFNDAWEESSSNYAVSHSIREGVYLEFVSSPDFDLMLKSLEAESQGIRLLNVRERVEKSINPQTGQENIHIVSYATVFIPFDRKQYFLNKITSYAENEDKRSGNPKNQKLINCINDIRKAVVASFWTDEDVSLIPREDPEWCEVWIRRVNSDSERLFDRFLKRNEICAKDRGIVFPETYVKLIKVNSEKIQFIIENFDYVAEFRRAQDAYYFLNIPPEQQTEWVQDLLQRLNILPDPTVSVCILDTGINNGHPLLSPIIPDGSCHTVFEEWGKDDSFGHGTLMAGIAAYGDLLEKLTSQNPVIIGHTLESAKIFQPNDKKEPELWGDITSQGISLAEINAPNKKRILCCAITAQDHSGKGKPSSWSGAIDQIISGANDDNKRLFFQCAGNVTDDVDNYPAAQQMTPVQDPAQAWNAVTVGAYTKLTCIDDKDFEGFKAIAPAGGLSPNTTTTLSWKNKEWPLKPDIVMEGGNQAVDGSGFVANCDELSLLSTYYRYTDRYFAPFDMTSAATANAAWFASQIRVKYPELWPETVRALMIHSAEWTDALKKEYLVNNNKNDYHNLLRVCGYGVPNLDKAMYSLTNSLTMIIEQEIQPFVKEVTQDTNGKRVPKYSVYKMHCFELPWPQETLRELPPKTEVSMRITLSYFIEPSPGETGWKDRYRYPSHGLRFDVKSPVESKADFIKRINKAARDEDEHIENTGQSTSKHWLIGQTRNKGSVHSDIWKGTAAELADSGIIAIYPTLGWWKTRPHIEKYNEMARYALLVSISTPEKSIDLYTPVVTKIGIKIPLSLEKNYR